MPKRLIFLLSTLGLFVVSPLTAQQTPFPHQTDESHRLIPASLFDSYTTRSISGRAPGNFVVNTTVDSQDTADDGLCADDEGRCSLRAAIEQANSLSAGSTIDVPAGTYTLTVNADAQFKTALVATKTITLSGAGADKTIIDGNGTSTVFALYNTDNALVQGFTFTGGTGLVVEGVNVVGGGLQLWYW